ncbi:hypothetical protein Tco_1466363 [Tanacetum coccineum]
MPMVTFHYKLSRRAGLAVTESLLPLSNTFYQDHSVMMGKHFDHVDSMCLIYDALKRFRGIYSNSVNIDVTPNNPLTHVQNGTSSTSLENIIGDKSRRLLQAT